MGRFDFFKFLDERRLSIPPSVDEIDNFDPFMVQMALSMAPGMDDVLDRINTEGFFNLPKKYQCLSFKSLDGCKLSGVWQKTKKKTLSKANDELPAKVMRVFKCSENDAISYIDGGLIDKKVINELYLRAFDPDNIKIRKKKLK